MAQKPSTKRRTSQKGAGKPTGKWASVARVGARGIMGGYWLKDPDGETAVTITGKSPNDTHAYAGQIAAAMTLTTSKQRTHYNAEQAGYRLKPQAAEDYEQMTAAEYSAALARLGLSNYAFCPRVGLDLRTGQNYAGGHTRIPGPLATLIRLLVRHPALLGELG